MCIIESKTLKDVCYLAGSKEEFAMLLEIIDPGKEHFGFYTGEKAKLFLQVKHEIEEAIKEK